MRRKMHPRRYFWRKRREETRRKVKQSIGNWDISMRSSAKLTSKDQQKNSHTNNKQDTNQSLQNNPSISNPFNPPDPCNCLTLTASSSPTRPPSSSSSSNKSPSTKTSATPSTCSVASKTSSERIPPQQPRSGTDCSANSRMKASACLFPR